MGRFIFSTGSMAFLYRTPPLAHQRAELQAHAGERAWFLRWEMGTGKTYVVLNTAAYLFLRRQIDALVVVAPNGVHRNWLTEVAQHLPVDALTYVWASANTQRERGTREQWRLAAATPTLRLPILLMSIDGVMTPAGHRLLNATLTSCRTLLVLDESTDIAHPGAARTKRLRALARRATYRRALSGLPSAEGWLPLFSQFDFLTPGALGAHSYATYKNLYGVWREDRTRAGQSYPVLIGTKNLDQLQDYVSRLSSRVLKKDCLDLPPKLYKVYTHALTPAQRELYAALIDEFELATYPGAVADTADLDLDLPMVTTPSGRTIEAHLVITLRLRLQQIVCGYVGARGDNVAEPLAGPNARVAQTVALIRAATGGVIVWARWTPDFKLLSAAFTAARISFAHYTGPANHRAQIIEQYQAGELKVFLANPESAGYGLTLTATHTMVFYNSSFSAGDRLQAESRAHRYGLHNPILIVDYEAETPDGLINIDAVTRRRREGKITAAHALMGDSTHGE